MGERGNHGLLFWITSSLFCSCYLKYLSDQKKKNISLASSRSLTSSLSPVIEICLSDIESVRSAFSGGASSVELCVDRGCGGITPSFGLIKESCRIAKEYDGDREVQVLIRPRDGNFIYSDNEFDVILRDVILARDAGAHGVVVGILRHDLTVDTVRMAVIRSISYPMKLTFHRAFDVCVTPLYETIDQIISLDCDRLLTSGRSVSASDNEGKKCLQQITQYLTHLRHQSPSLLQSFPLNHSLFHLQIVAAGGVKVDNTAELIRSTRVHGIHAGNGVLRDKESEENQESICSGFDGESSLAVDEEKVVDLVQVAEDCWDEIKNTSEG